MPSSPTTVPILTLIVRNLDYVSRARVPSLQLEATVVDDRLIVKDLAGQLWELTALPFVPQESEATFIRVGEKNVKVDERLLVERAPAPLEQFPVAVMLSARGGLLRQWSAAEWQALQGPAGTTVDELARFDNVFLCTRTVCSVCQRPQFTDPRNDPPQVTCENKHVGAAPVPPAVPESRYVSGVLRGASDQGADVHYVTNLDAVARLGLYSGKVDAPVPPETGTPPGVLDREADFLHREQQKRWSKGALPLTCESQELRDEMTKCLTGEVTRLQVYAPGHERVVGIVTGHEGVSHYHRDQTVTVQFSRSIIEELFKTWSTKAARDWLGSVSGVHFRNGRFEVVQGRAHKDQRLLGQPIRIESMLLLVGFGIDMAKRTREYASRIADRVEAEWAALKQSPSGLVLDPDIDDGMLLSLRRIQATAGSLEEEIRGLGNSHSEFMRQRDTPPRAGGLRAWARKAADLADPDVAAAALERLRPPTTEQQAVHDLETQEDGKTKRVLAEALEAMKPISGLILAAGARRLLEASNAGYESIKRIKHKMESAAPLEAMQAWELEAEVFAERARAAEDLAKLLDQV